MGSLCQPLEEQREREGGTGREVSEGNQCGLFLTSFLFRRKRKPPRIAKIGKHPLIRGLCSVSPERLSTLRHSFWEC
jgi:hypothetical protein